MFYAIVFVATLCALFYYYLIKPHSYWKEKRVKQGKPTLLFGDNLEMLRKRRNIAEINLELYYRFDNCRYIGFYQMLLPTLLIKDPQLIKQLTVKDFDHFVDRRQIFVEHDESIWEKNLFALSGQKWRDMRATLSQSFSNAKMKYMFSLITETADSFVDHFLEKDGDVITVEMKDTFTKFTNDVIATSAFGIKVDSLKNETNELYLMGKEATDFLGCTNLLKFLGCMACPNLLKFLGINFFNQKVLKFFEEIICETIKTRQNKGIVRNDMINILMESRKETNKMKQLSDSDIAGQAFAFFLAGFDTVSSLTCFLSYELALNQDIQDKLREEIQTTLEEENGQLTYDGLMKMKYLDMIISECMRKWPNIAFDRVCSKPYTIEPQLPGEKPVHLTYGDIIWIPVFALQRDPKYFPDPEKFDPERFNEENRGNIKPYTYMPFGSGPRNCIGSRFAIMETKTVFFKLLSKFRIIPTEKTDIPIKLSTNTLTSETGFWLGLQKIN